MDKKIPYKIPYKGIKNGLHQYHFKVSEDFFELLNYSRINQGKFDIEVCLDKKDNIIVIDIEYSGEYEASCDRCLNEIMIPIDGSDRLIYKSLNFTSDLDIDNENIFVLEEQDNFIDLSIHINDIIQLSLPISNLRDCETESFKYCNKEILQILNFEKNNSALSQKDDTWKVLKDIKLNK